MQEAIRRKVFLVVAGLTLVSGALFSVGAYFAFDSTESLRGSELVEERTLTGATLLGLAMFGTLFLGTVLAVFLTLGAVRGDAERGLLQPIVVRPVGRSTFLLARFAGAAAVSSAYAATVYGGAILVVGLIGDWWPDRVATAALGLALGVAVLTALALLGSVVLSATANGVAVFMVFGAGLVAGLLGEIGEALNSDTLETIARVAAWVLPFEALYQAGLDALTADTSGITRVVVSLGPFGGAEPAGFGLWVWAVAYLGLVGFAAIALFARADL
jgi:hypothetical protein